MSREKAQDRAANMKAEYEEAAASALGISEDQRQMLVRKSMAEDLRQRRGYSDPHSMMSGIIPQRESPTARSVVSDRGWVNPNPIERPPGIDIIDRMCLAQAAKDRKKLMEEG